MLPKTVVRRLLDLEFPRETGLILRCAGKAGNPFQTTQGRRAPAERLLWPGRASPSAPQLLAFSPGKEQAAGALDKLGE